MHPFAALTGFRQAWAPRAAGGLWLLALLLLLQWNVPGLGQSVAEPRAGQGEASGGMAAQPLAKLRDGGKLAGTELRAKDGKQQTAPGGGGPAFVAAIRALFGNTGRSALGPAAEQVAPGRIAHLAFEARAPPVA